VHGDRAGDDEQVAAEVQAKLMLDRLARSLASEMPTPA